MAEQQDHTIVMGKGERPLGAGSDAFMGTPPKARLVCLDDSLLDPSQKGLVVKLDGQEKVFGRDESNSAPLRYAKVSRVHARVYPGDGKWLIEDLQSTNGVYVNDVRLTAARALRPGDYVRIGAIPFRLVLERPEGLGSSTPAHETGEEESGRTVMFDSVGLKAADMLMRAEESSESASHAKPANQPATVAQPVFTSAGSYTPTADRSPVRGRNTSLLVGAVVMLIAGLGAAYYLLSHSGAKQETQAIAKGIRDYTLTHEETASALSPEAAAVAEGIISRGQQAVAQHPNEAALRELLAQAYLLRLEQQITAHLAKNQARDAFKAVESAAAEIGQLKQPGGKGPEEAVNILAVAREVVTIKMFRQAYPSPSEQATAKPGIAELSLYLGSRGRFFELKRQPTTDTLLKTQYKHLGRLVSTLDNEDIPFLDQWKMHVK